jgi:hypothetical protein
MKINHENMMKPWKEWYGKGVEKVKDRKGRIMLKTAFGDPNSKYGGNIYHKKSQAKDGTNTKENLEFVHYKTHTEINGKK